MTAKPTRRDDPGPPTPVTKRSTGSFEVAERNRIECLILANEMQIVDPDLAEEGRALALIFERWTTGVLVGRDIQPQIVDFSERTRNLARLSQFVGDAARRRRAQANE